MMLERVGMLAADTRRSKYYLHVLAQRGLLPARAILLDDPAVQHAERQAEARRPSSPNVREGFDLRSSLQALLERHHIPCERIASMDPNCDDAVSAVTRCPADMLIYSGPPGAILRGAMLGTGKRFLHVHPGALPAYAGSTTLYYSLLHTGACAATALFLGPQLDGGDVIRTRQYPPPEDRTRIDLDYDPWIRAQLLADVLEDYARTGRMRSTPQPPGGRETYFIIHPVLKHLAVFSRRAVAGASP
jgi:methionyl-tRNA formyltransferase